MRDRTAIVVPGHSRRGRMTRRCRRLLVAAAALAERERPDVVVFTGGRGGEAEQMRASWTGRGDVELVVEPTAATTAQNASRSAALLRERGVGRATVVCAPLHVPRVRYLFGGVYARAGIGWRVRAARTLPTPPALAWELAAAAVARRQRRAALEELDDA
ncbi:MAG TPA: YdcF family protein [Gaiellaceae bacterium]|nr:YdcF family protein [Gaiellaceae bacterium]